MKHPILERHGTFAGHVELGRAPKKTDPRTLQAREFIDEAVALPKTPASLALQTGIADWPMYGNDRLGDCTCAAAGHMVEAWSHAAGALKTPLDSDVEHFYIPVTGRDDDGRNEIDVLNAWRKIGFGGDKIDLYAEVEVKEQAIKTSTFLFGGLYTGVGLPITAQTQHVWDVVPNAGSAGQPGSWGGHAVPFVGYDTGGVYLITWGAVLKATWRFVAEYFEEAYAVLSNDWLKKTGSDIHGLNLAALTAALKQVTA